VPTRVRIDRDDLERLTSAATAFVMQQRVLREQRIEPFPDFTVEVDGAPVRVSGQTQAADLDALEDAVIRTRRLLGWRR